MSQAGPEAPDLRDYFRLLRRRGWILLLCLILLPAAAYFYTDARPKIFEASTLLEVNATADAGTVSPDFAAPTTNIQAVASFVSTSAVAEEAARQLGEPRTSLYGAASATADEDTGFITLKATGPTAARAAAVTNAFAAALNATRAERGRESVQSAIVNTRNQLRETPRADVATRTTLTQQLQKLEALEGAQSQNLRVLQPASGATQIAPHPRRNATIAIFLALLIGIGLVVLSDKLDRRVHKPEELEKLTGLPFLATIPEEAFTEGPDAQVVTEAFRTLRNSLTFFNVDGELRSLMVVSSLKGEGKTTAAASLAVSYANFGKSVVLVDTDLRKPELAQRLGTETGPGLSQVLAGTVELGEAVRDLQVGDAALRFLSGGPVPPNPSALLGSDRMKQVLAELSEQNDLVILDTTPLLVVSDAFPLLDQVSGIVPLARLHQTPREAIKRMIHICTTAGGRVLGLVATGGTRSIDTQYGYGYGYGYGDEPKRRGLRRSNPANERPAAANSGGDGAGDDVTVERA